MKKKTIVKILLDAAMILVIALMYSKQALGLAFHEIGGLALIGVFLVHKGLNFEWIRRVTARLGSADGRTKLMWIVDALMLVSFLLVGVSGLLISKVAFPALAVQGGPWKAIHYSCAALSLLLVGVHLGLHSRYLKGVLSRWVKLPRAVAAVMILLLMAYGAYGVASTGFTRWLVMPFSSGVEGGEGNRRGGFPEAAQSLESGDGSAVVQEGASAAESAQESTQESTQESARQGARGGHEGQSGSAGNALKTLAQFFSISFLFAALTAFIERALRMKKQRAAL